MKELSVREIIVIIICGLWNFAGAMSAVFVNVYLYNYTGSLVVMSIYTIFRIGMFPIFFSLGGWLARKTNFAYTTLLGALVTMMSLIFILFFNHLIAQNNNLVYIVAILVGIGEGFFWLSINSLNQLVTTDKTRNIYVGYLGIINNLLGIFAPIAATILISLGIDDTEGYTNIFKVVLIIYAIIVILATRVKVPPNRSKYSLIKSLSILHDKRWRYSMIATLMYGIRDGLILTVAGLLVYNATNGSGEAYSRLLALFAIVGIIAYSLVTRWLNITNRYKFYVIGAFLLASCSIVLVFINNIYGAIYYGLVNAIGTPFYSSPYQIIIIENINRYHKSENVVGRVIGKETYLSIGRISGMILVIICFMIFPESLYLKISVTLLSLFPIILVAYSYKHEKN